VLTAVAMQFYNQKFSQLFESSRFHGVIFLCFIMYTSACYSQEKQQRLTNSAVERNIHTTIQSNQIQAGNQLSQEEIQLSINQLNDHLKAIETKRVWINSAAERIVEANENGWFEQMLATEKELIKRRDELNALLNEVKK
jgi:hypothetical protein